MASLYCEKHFQVVDKQIETLKSQCPGEWAKVVDGRAQGDYFCDECSSPIFIGQKARYAIFLSEGLLDPMKEEAIFSQAGKSMNVLL